MDEASNSTVLLHCPTLSSSFPADLEYSLLFLQILSIIFEAFHFCLLFYLSRGSRTAYHKVVLNIAAADLAYCFRGIFTLLWKNVDEVRYRPWAIVITFQDFISLSRILALAFASLERFVAIVTPIRHSSCAYIKYMNVWICLGWVGIALYTAISSVIVMDKVCIGIYGIPTSQYSSITRIGYGVWAYALLLTTLVLLIGVWAKIFRIKALGGGVGMDPEAKSGAKFVLANFTIVLLLIILPLILMGMGAARVFRYHWVFISPFLFTLYGIANTLIYIILSKNYREGVKKTFIKFLHKQRRALSSPPRQENEIP